MIPRDREEVFAQTGPDHHQVPVVEEPLLELETLSLFAFPRGAKAGTLLHDFWKIWISPKRTRFASMKLAADKTDRIWF